MSPSLAANPRLGAWLSIRPDGRVEVRSGKAELGQGVSLALAQIAADELDVALERVVMVPTTTAAGPDEGYTAGSLSVSHSGAALRQVCAEGRAAYLQAAAGRLGAAVADLEVADGTIHAPGGATITYWALADDALLDRDASGGAAPKPATAGRLVGRSPVRPDLPAKLAGQPAYVHDLRLAGQLAGRVVRPPAPGAHLESVDPAPAAAVAGVVEVVCDGGFLGVVAEGDDAARRGAEALEATARWGGGSTLPDPARLEGFLRSAPAETATVHTAGARPGGRPDRVVSAGFSRPYLAHASIGPSCAVARWDGGRLAVWTHSQGVHPLRRALAAALGADPAEVVVTHVPGAGCYGHNGADDAAYDAALLARAVPGRPVQVRWSRGDELAWSPLAPAMAVEVTAELDANGAVRHWRHEVWSNGHSSRPWSPPRPPLLAQLHQADATPGVPAGDPPLAAGGGSTRNAVPGYRLPSVEVVAHHLQVMPLRTSAMRSLGAHLNVFATESVIDELAAAAGADPLAYRLGLLDDPRARAVLEAAAAAGEWGGSYRPGGTTGGRGLGYARYKGSGAYCAVVADIEAETQLRVRRLTVAADLGEVVNPAGAAAQLEGAAVQAVSWTVKEQVRFDAGGVTSRGWDSYPILTFSEVPEVAVELVDGAGGPPLGAGEAAVGPTAAAIGNALAAALGVRIRRMPLTPEHIAAQLEGVPAWPT